MLVPLVVTVCVGASLAVLFLFESHGYCRIEWLVVTRGDVGDDDVVVAVGIWKPVAFHGAKILPQEWSRLVQLERLGPCRRLPPHFRMLNT